MKNQRKLPSILSSIIEPPEHNWANEIAIVAFCFGIGLLVWNAILYDRTMIPSALVWIIILIPGLPMTTLFSRQINTIARKEMHILLHYVLHTCTTGSIIAFAFLATNFYFASKNSSIKRVEILGLDSRDGGKGRGKRTPYVLIKYDDLEKSYLLTEFEVKCVKGRKDMIIETRHGLLGYDVIEK